MEATVYVIPGSHPSRTGMLMLDHKGVDYRPVVLKPALHAVAVRLLGFPGSTVPAAKIDGRRVQGTCRIARALDDLLPDAPRLLPLDPDLRRAVEEAESFGDAELQPAARRLAAAAGHRDPDAIHDRGDDGRLGPLLTHGVRSRKLILALVVRRFGATAEQERKDRERLPGWLDRIDAWIEQGVLNGPDLNAADLQLATSLALIDYVLDLRPLLDSRPAGALLDRVLPRPS